MPYRIKWGGLRQLERHSARGAQLSARAKRTAIKLSQFRASSRCNVVIPVQASVLESSLANTLRALLLFALVLLSVLVQSPLAQAAPDQLLFGPKQYLRTTGAPNQYTDTFSVPVSVGAPFLLRIVNGQANGSNRISSATVTLNGVQVAGPSEFAQNVALITRAVNLGPSNTLDARVASTPGGYLTGSVLGTRRVAGLPDSGQATCYNGTAMVACTNANTGDAATYPGQDGRFGRDAKATTGALTKIGGGAAGFDYSKIANNGGDLGAGVGLALGAKSTDWACTRDNITGLTWEAKVNDASHLRHWSWTYTWYGSDASSNGGSPGTASGTTNCKTLGRCDTEKFVADVNAAALCGFADWRMPTQSELLTLVHAGAQNPSIDATYFPNTQASNFWSATSYVPSALSAWYVDFVGGTNVFPKAHSSYVRLVRGGQF